MEKNYEGILERHCSVYQFISWSVNYLFEFDAFEKEKIIMINITTLETKKTILWKKKKHGEIITEFIQ